MMKHRYIVSLDDPSVCWRSNCYYDAHRPADVARVMLGCDPSGQFDRGAVYVRTVIGLDFRRYREYAVRYAGTLSTDRVWIRR